MEPDSGSAVGQRRLFGASGMHYAVIAPGSAGATTAPAADLDQRGHPRPIC